MQMNLAELAKAVDLIGIPARVVSLGGPAENSWCVDQTPDGTWEVFWMERGTRSTWSASQRNPPHASSRWADPPTHNSLPE